MSEGKDPGIKLFGKTIQLPEISLLHPDSSPLPPSVYHVPDLPSSPFSKTEDASSEQEADKDSFGKELTDSKEKDGTQALKSEDISDSKTSSLKHENSEKPSSVDNEVETVKSSKTEEEHSETSNSEEKTLKKPDKILPCPRCNSMDTKFCYYNNYNVNQPRHFCKKCQRYWTAGGTMRNVPVGAGRRKNKNLASQYHHHMSVSEALQSTCVDGPHHPTVNANGTVLAFGEPRSTVTVRTCTQNDGFHKAEELKRSVPHVDNGDDLSSGSSITAANSKDEMCQIGLQDPRLNFPQQVQCFPGAPWPYPWTSPQWNSAVAPPGYPMPFYPVSPYWATTVPPGSWNLQWVPQPVASSMLGKHSREEKEMSTSREEPEKENNHEKCLWFPKTMRVDEPGEESRISLWATLGFQNDQADCVRGGSLFKAFKSKGEEKTHISESSLVLNANPAALSRSLNFHESS